MSIITIVTWFLFSSLVNIDKAIILEQVNKIRSEGCYCGNEYQKKVGPVKWNATLFTSALSHAKEMSKHGFFSHYSKDGKDIGQRLTDIGYPWLVVGENIGEGQNQFDEVLEDWLASKTHCKMLMDERVDEMAVAKHRKIWVQHFGKQMQKKKSRSPRN